MLLQPWMADVMLIEFAISVSTLPVSANPGVSHIVILGLSYFIEFMKRVYAFMSCPISNPGRCSSGIRITFSVSMGFPLLWSILEIVFFLNFFPHRKCTVVDFPHPVVPNNIRMSYS